MCKLFWLCILFVCTFSFGHDVPRVAPRFVIDLDSDPKTRWTPIVSQFKDEYGPVLAFLNHLYPPALQPLLDPVIADLDNLLGYPYADELRSVVSAVPELFDLAKVLLLNFAYEVTAFGCTSIVAQNAQDEILHARNLDYEIDGLENITIQVDYQRNNRTIYSSTHFAGYVGILTGVRHGGWSVTVNERDHGTLIDNLASLLLAGGKSIGFFLRNTLETNSTFDEAVETLQHTPLIAAVYLTVAGVRSGEGVIITRDRNNPADVWNLLPPRRWFILQTNDDHWLPPEDGRRDAANHGMSEMNITSVDLNGMYQVLSTPPVFQPSTRYTTLICAVCGTIHTYIRFPPSTLP